VSTARQVVVRDAALKVLKAIEKDGQPLDDTAKAALAQAVVEVPKPPAGPGNAPPSPAR
jgi:hypothetical protein